MKHKIFISLITSILTWLCVFGSLHLILYLRGLHPKIELMYLIKSFSFFVILGIISGCLSVIFNFSSLRNEIVVNLITFMICSYLAGSILQTAESGVNVFFALLSLVVTAIYFFILILLRRWRVFRN
jgi:hypothetical protein